MLFNSHEFAVLFAVTAILYYLPPLRKLQPGILLISSFIFYSHHNPMLLALLMFSIVCNALGSYAILRYPLQKARWLTLIAVSVNIGILGAFKYAGLLARSLWGEAADGSQVGHFLITIPLPLGISFFTFQGISLLIDCFRSRESDHLERKIASLHEIHHSGFWRFSLDTALYIAFFPQLVAGPIVKARDFYFQIQPKYFSRIPWDHVFRFVVLGYFLKMVVADNLKDRTYYLTYPLFLELDWMTLLSLLLGYSMQIFSDFAGYSAIAIGLSSFFGYVIPVNFRKPYIAQSFADFWSRWHISLSTWLKEYLYFGLGGNRKGAVRTYINLFLVMFLGGLWHGASWNYAFWGIFHGLALATERALRGSRPDDSPNPVVAVLRTLFVFAFVTHAWLFFILRDFNQYTAFWKALLSGNENPNFVWIAYVLIYSVPIVLYHLKDLVWESIPSRAKALVEPAVFGAMIWLIIFNSGSAGEFIYFQF